MFNRILNTSSHEIVLIEINVFKFYVVDCYVASDECINIEILLLRPEFKVILEASLVSMLKKETHFLAFQCVVSTKRSYILKMQLKVVGLFKSA